MLSSRVLLLVLSLLLWHDCMHVRAAASSRTGRPKRGRRLTRCLETEFRIAKCRCLAPVCWLKLECFCAPSLVASCRIAKCRSLAPVWWLTRALLEARLSFVLSEFIFFFLLVFLSIQEFFINFQRCERTPC